MKTAFVVALGVCLAACGSRKDPPGKSSEPAATTAAPKPTASATVPEKPKAPVFSTAANVPGPLLIAVQDGGVYVYDKGKLTELEVKRADSFFQTAAGTVVIQGGYPNYALTPEDKTVDFRIPIGNLAPAADGSFWDLLPSNELSHEPADQQLGATAAKEKIPARDKEYVSKILLGKSGDVYLAGLNEFYRKRGSEWKKTTAGELIKAPPPGPDGLEEQIQGILPIGDEVYAIVGTAAYTIEGKKLDLPPTTAGVVYSHDMPTVSAAGVVAFHTGLEYVVVSPDGKATSRNIESLGIQGADQSRSIAVDGQGRRWVGTNAGLVVLSKDDKVLQTWPAGSLPGAAVRLFVVGAGPELAAEPPPVVKGNVKGKVFVNNEPLKSSELLICDSPATVMIGPTPCSGKVPTASTKTDADGTFHFTDVPAWSYGFAMKTESGWTAMYGSSLGQCCKNVKPGTEIDVGNVVVKVN